MNSLELLLGDCGCTEAQNTLHMHGGHLALSTEREVSWLLKRSFY